jgi:hypothetical protein
MRTGRDKDGGPAGKDAPPKYFPGGVSFADCRTSLG